MLFVVIAYHTDNDASFYYLTTWGTHLTFIVFGLITASSILETQGIHTYAWPHLLIEISLPIEFIITVLFWIFLSRQML